MDQSRICEPKGDWVSFTPLYRLQAKKSLHGQIFLPRAAPVTLRFKAVRYLKLQEAQWKMALLKVGSSVKHSNDGIDDLPHRAIQEPFPW
jgi:hypothetical protein